MVQIFIIFLIIIRILAAILGAAVAFRSKQSGNIGEIDSQYKDEDGNHIYYDRSRLEKEEFLRHHPDEKPRSLSRIFSRKR